LSDCCKCQVASTDTVISREYTYTGVGEYGVHVVNVRAFNLANNDTVSASVDVLEWPCQAPNISIDPQFIDQNSPFIALEENGFTVTAEFSVSCMKNERFNAKWEILDATQTTVLTTVANASQLVSASNALSAGDYVIRVNATLWSGTFDLSDKTVVGYGYVTIERCQTPNVSVSPSFASQGAPYKALVEHGFTVTVSYSFDCAKMEQYNIRWDLLDSAQQPVTSLANATQLITEPNALTAGSYVVRINITMSSSYFDLSHKAAVAYGYVDIYYCEPTVVTLDPQATESSPFSAPDVEGFTVTVGLVVDCPPMEQLYAVWDILDSQQSVVRNEPNATQLVSSSYALPVGIYAVRVNITLWSSVFDLSEKTVVSSTYVNITRTSLVAGIAGSEYINATFNSTVYLSAYNHTYSSGQTISDKHGMVFEWRCRRSNETWPTPLPTQSYLPYNGTGGGCFGDAGAGVLGFAEGKWSFSFYTGFLEPVTEYKIEFLVEKDSKSASAEVTLYVQRPLAPNITIR